MKEVSFGPVTLVPGLRNGRYPFCHSLYVEAEQRVIIDPASNRERLAELKAGPGVDMAWLSHYHEDHFKDLDLFQDRELWAHDLDAPPFEALGNLMDYYGMVDEEERRLWERIMVEQFHYQARRVDRGLQGGEVIDLGGLTVEVLHTPGHTPGHCSFFFREPALLFLGDYDLTPFGPWYGDRDSDIEATLASIERLRRAPARVWVAAHEQGLFETDPGPAWDRYAALIQSREARLLDLLGEPRTMADIVATRILYGKAKMPKEFIEFGERAHMDKHLERLMARGAVVRDGDFYLRT
ncbi:MAG: MBL fold metallo-hydrolase [Proteobacteria bacterium]|nr:MBL fold metallo-hydrolase [Pseudomonadota bacterium]